MAIIKIINEIIIAAVEEVIEEEAIIMGKRKIVKMKTSEAIEEDIEAIEEGKVNIKQIIEKTKSLLTKSLNKVINPSLKKKQISKQMTMQVDLIKYLLKRSKSIMVKIKISK